jgi:sphingomyelin phosphodiesterase acid-like 3
MAAAGYYVIDHPVLTDTELVVLNDIYWSNRYSADSCHSQPNEKAGDEEMAWLKGQLESAKTAQKKVILVMHIPPQADIFSTLKAMTEKVKKQKSKEKIAEKGKKKSSKLFWEDKYEEAYVQLMREYSDVVTLAFAGHTHMDDFRLLNDDSGKPFLVTHISPAVSPIRFNNPGFQVMEYDKTSGAIQDEATFYLKNLSAAKNSNDGQWDLEYDFNSAYGLNGYNADNLKTLTDAIDNDPQTLSKFAQYYVVSAPEIIKEDSWKVLNDIRAAANDKEVKTLLKK